MNGAVSSAELAENSVTAGKLRITWRTKSANVPSGATWSHLETCPPPEKLVTGGAEWSGNFTPAQAQATHLVHSYPIGYNGWAVRGYNGSGSQRTFTLRIVCILAG